MAEKQRRGSVIRCGWYGEHMSESSSLPTYLLVDGENIDATLGMSLLGRHPDSEERPRWDRVLTFCDRLAGYSASTEDEDEPETTGTNALFFLNVTSGHMPMGFIQALMAMDYRPLPLSGSGNPEEKVVDIGIQRTLDAIAQRVEQGHNARILLGSHDVDYLPYMERLLDAGASVGILCFREYLSGQLASLTEKGLEIYDLEADVRAFTIKLPRVRVIPLDSYNPFDFI